jgi:hypothetical protein
MAKRKREGLTIQWLKEKEQKDIKDIKPVRGQDRKISDTQGKDFWSPTRLCRVGDQ